MQKPPGLYNGLIYTTFFLGALDACCPIRVGAKKPYSVADLDVTRWFEASRSITHWLDDEDDRGYTVYVERNPNLTMRENRAIKKLTDDWHLYRGSVLIVKHTDERRLLRMTLKEESRVAGVLSWCVLPCSRPMCVDLTWRLGFLVTTGCLRSLAIRLSVAFTRRNPVLLFSSSTSLPQCSLCLTCENMRLRITKSDQAPHSRENAVIIPASVHHGVDSEYARWSQQAHISN